MVLLEVHGMPLNDDEETEEGQGQEHQLPGRHLGGKLLQVLELGWAEIFF